MSRAAGTARRSLYCARTMEELNCHNGLSLRWCIRFRDHVTDWPHRTGRGPWMSQDEAKPRPKGTDRLRALQIRRKCKIDLSTPGPKGTDQAQNAFPSLADVGFGRAVHALNDLIPPCHICHRPKVGLTKLTTVGHYSSLAEKLKRSISFDTVACSA